MKTQTKLTTISGGSGTKEYLIYVTMDVENGFRFTVIYHHVAFAFPWWENPNKGTEDALTTMIEYFKSPSFLNWTYETPAVTYANNDAWSRFVRWYWDYLISFMRDMAISGPAVDTATNSVDTNGGRIYCGLTYRDIKRDIVVTIRQHKNKFFCVPSGGGRSYMLIFCPTKESSVYELIETAQIANTS